MTSSDCEEWICAAYILFAASSLVVVALASVVLYQSYRYVFWAPALLWTLSVPYLFLRFGREEFKKLQVEEELRKVKESMEDK